MVGCKQQRNYSDWIQFQIIQVTVASYWLILIINQIKEQQSQVFIFTDISIQSDWQDKQMKARSTKKDANTVFQNRMLKGKKKGGRREASRSPKPHLKEHESQPTGSRVDAQLVSPQHNSSYSKVTPFDDSSQLNQLQTSPRQKKTKYSDQVQAYMEKSNMTRFQAQDRKVPFDENEVHKVRDQPHNHLTSSMKENAVQDGNYTDVNLNHFNKHKYNQTPEQPFMSPSPAKDDESQQPFSNRHAQSSMARQANQFSPFVEDSQHVGAMKVEKLSVSSQIPSEVSGQQRINIRPANKDHCKNCNKQTYLQSVCQSCGMVSFNQLIEDTQRQLTTIEEDVDMPANKLNIVFSHKNSAQRDQLLNAASSRRSVEGCTPNSIANNMTEHGYGANGARSSHDGSHMKPAGSLSPTMTRHNNSQALPFNYAPENDRVSSAGGGEPVEMGDDFNQPSDNNHAFIFEHASESTAQHNPEKSSKFDHVRESQTQLSILRPSVMHPRIDDVDSLPASLKDSKDTLSAVKNQSRYGDESATTMKAGDIAPFQPIRIFQDASKRTILSNPTNQHRFQEMQLQIVPTREEFKEPIPADSASIRNNRRPLNEGNKISAQHNGKESLHAIPKYGQVTPYSFADGLNLNHDREGVKRSLMSERLMNNTDQNNGVQSSLELHLQKNQNDRVTRGSTGRVNGPHPKYQHNPFQMAESADEYHQVSKHALNRMTSNFGNSNIGHAINQLQGSSNGSCEHHGTLNNQILLQGTNTGPHKAPQSKSRLFALSQEIEQSPKTRVLTTEVPESDNYRHIDSARHHLITSNNGEDLTDKRLNLRESLQQKDILNHSEASSSRRHQTVKQSQTMQAKVIKPESSFLDEHCRHFSLDTKKVGKAQEARLKRQVTFRLTIRQISTLQDRYNRWRDSMSFCERLWQQQSKHWLFIPTFSRAQIFFSILTLTFSFLGFLFYFSAHKAQTMVVDYGDKCALQGRQCSLELEPEVDLLQPHLYYELDPFFSNHLKIVTTMPLYKQLRGRSIPSDGCQGIEKVKDLLPDLSVYNDFTEVDLASLDPETPLNPCGILPKYVFTDSFRILDANSQETLEIDETGIASEWDLTHKFVASEDEFQWLDVTNEHFVVWHQMDTVNTVFRLYGQLQDDLKKGEKYLLEIDNSYDAASIFGGSKKLHLQEVNQLGGSNKFLGLLFICTAILIVLIQFIFLTLYVMRVSNKAGGSEAFYDPDQIEW